MTTAAHDDPASEHLDVLVVGAGLSGIGAAYRLQEQCPGTSYAVLEARAAIGGTWDLFRYPGVRSDSDVFTLSYPFRPWRGRDVAGRRRQHPELHRHDRRRGRHRAAHPLPDQGRRRRPGPRPGPGGASGPWSARTRHRAPSRARSCTCAPATTTTTTATSPTSPAAQDFRGRLVHPQRWPEDLDHTGQRVVVIGSGATAVTLVPAMAEQAARSPCCSGRRPT